MPTFRADVDLIARVRTRIDVFAADRGEALDRLEAMDYDEMRALGSLRDDGEEPVTVFECYLLKLEG